MKEKLYYVSSVKIKSDNRTENRSSNVWSENGIKCEYGEKYVPTKINTSKHYIESYQDCKIVYIITRIA